VNLLGLDYGAAHIGVAIATGSLAEPLTTLSTSQAIEHLKTLVTNNKITAIIIGDTSASFKDALLTLHLPIYQTDETLSSHDARLALLHTTQTRRKVKEHAVAAAVILQSWLDSHSSIL
jgi:RNase H-fold protein (predicted Holliday junction resolvase)